MRGALPPSGSGAAAAGENREPRSPARARGLSRGVGGGPARLARAPSHSERPAQTPEAIQFIPGAAARRADSRARSRGGRCRVRRPASQLAPLPQSWRLGPGSALGPLAESRVERCRVAKFPRECPPRQSRPPREPRASRQVGRRPARRSSPAARGAGERVSVGGWGCGNAPWRTHGLAPSKVLLRTSGAGPGVWTGMEESHSRSSRGPGLQLSGSPVPPGPRCQPLPSPSSRVRPRDGPPPSPTSLSPVRRGLLRGQAQTSSAHSATAFTAL